MKIKLAVVSIILSVAGIISTLFINYNIAQTYAASDGKTKALFGIVEQTRFGYQFYLGFFGILAIYTGISAIKSKEPKPSVVLAFALAIISIVLVFVRIWRIFI